MSKELEALENIREQSKTHGWLEQQFEKEWLNTIEKALKDKEDIDSILNTGGGIWAENGIVAKKLKALDIIKAKKVDTEKLWLVENAYAYNNFGKVHVIPLTDEEFDLVKEVLSWKQ